MSRVDEAHLVPIRLCTLGGLRVQLGETVLPRLRDQPISAGVLLYLALERSVSRDHLTSIVWPDIDAQKVRHRLSQTLYVLRERLGRGWVDSSASLITVSDAVSTDVTDFVSAVEEGRLADALDLYAGPFLDGVYLIDTPEFESWAESRRALYASQHRASSSTEIDRLSRVGDREGALEVARQWVRHDPTDEEANFVLIELLGELGQRAQAVRHFEQFERLLREAGLDATADARTQELIRRIKTHPSASTASSSQPVERQRPAGSQGTAVAVVPFENQSELSKDAYLSQSLTDELISRLTRVEGIQVVPRSSVAAFRGVAYQPSLMGAELGVDAILEGSVQSADSEIRVRARVISVLEERYIWEDDFAVTEERILDVQGEIAEGIAAALKEQLTSEDQRLLRAPPTSSPRAWLHFGSAVSQLRSDAEQGLEGAIDSLERALQEDPGFSAALSRLTNAYAKLDLRRKLSRFQGRDEELVQLRRLIAAVDEGRGRFAVLSGRAGIGKTSLVWQLRDSLWRGRDMFVGRCRARGRTSPFDPFAHALRDGFGIDDSATTDDIEKALQIGLDNLDADLKRHLPMYRHVLGVQAAEEVDPQVGAAEERRGAIVRALGDLLRARSEAGTVVLVLEDWQWADEGSRAVLLSLARSLTDVPVLLLVTHRMETPQSWPGLNPVRIELGDLTEPQADELICSILGTEDVSAELSSLIRELAGGNPFHIEEFCRNLSEDQVIVDEDGIARLKIRAARPAGDIQAILKARIDRLDRTAAEASTLALLAVLGREASLPLLRRLTDSDDALLVALSRLRELDLVQAVATRSAPVLDFKHEITQDVAFESSDRRAELHRQVGHALEELYREGRLEEHLEELAYHFSESGDAERACYYLELAGDRAFRSFSLADARRMYHRAIKLLEQDDTQAKRRAELSFKWIEAGMQAGSEEQLTVLQRSFADARRLGSDTLMARCLYWLGWVHYTLGNLRESLRLFERCRDITSEFGEGSSRAQIKLNLAYAYAAATDYDSALQYFEDGIRDREALSRAGRSRGLAYAYGYLAMINAERGAFDTASEWLARASSIVELPERRSVEGSVRTQEAFSHAFAWDWEKCKQAAARVREIGDEIGGSYIEAMGLTLQGYAMFWMGEGGVGLIQRGVQQLEETRAFLYISWSYACLADVHARSGRFDEARAAALKSLERIEVQDRLGEALALQVLGKIEASSPSPDWDVVRRHMEEAARVCEERGSSRGVAEALLRHAELLASAGDKKKEAQAALDAALQRLENPHHFFTKEVEFVRSRLGR